MNNPPDTIRCLDGRTKPRKCQIEYISFSAHVDYAQNLRFIRSVQPDNIILVHGEKKMMRKLRDELEREVSRSWPSKHRPPIKTPMNGQSVKISFTKSVVADMVGSAADSLLQAIENDAPLELASNMMVVNENFNIKAVQVEEIKKYTPCRLGKLTQRLLVPVPAGLNIYNAKATYSNGYLLHALAPYIQEVFDAVSLAQHPDWIINVSDLVIVAEISGGTIISVEWPASPHGDAIADTVVGIVSQFLSIPSILRQLGQAEKGSSLKGHKHELIEETLAATPVTDEVVKKMKLGLLDPMKSLYFVYNGVDASIKIADEVKLDNLRVLLQGLPDFVQVLFNSDKTKLIIRGKLVQEGEEAFCFIRWDVRPQGTEHHAVISSESSSFKEKVVTAIKTIYHAN